MKHETTKTIPSMREKITYETAISREAATYYELRLFLSGLPPGGAEEVQAVLEMALAASAPDGQVSVQSVVESPPLREGDWVEEHIIPLSVLFCTLPVEFQRAALLTALSEQYHRELACLWRSVRDERCKLPVIEVRRWRQAGSQWICEFLSYDRGAPQSDQYNLHGQNTSQWQNRETGWTGHQGALVLDTHDGQISAHH